MTGATMINDIEKQYQRLMVKRRELLQRLETYSADMLSFKAGPDKWSATEAIEHLVVVEDNFLAQVSTNTPVSSLDPEKRSPDKYQAVLRVMRQDVEVDVPHESIEPRGQFGLETLIQRWDDIREKMHALLDSIGPGREGDMVYLHPYGGPLNVTEALAFMEVHFDNHARHMDVILARAE
jgi:hypothetical protein